MCMKFIDLFAGVGGFHEGIRRANPKAECVYSNEWDKHAAEVYRKHFGECDTTDITTVRAEDIPGHDLICGGFPCQAFSVAGKRRGFEETRGTLFFDILRIARHHRTPYLLLENVKGFLNHDGGATFHTILRSLDELGYDCQWQVLNSKDFGVPQNRERVFIVGHLRGKPRPQVFPIGQTTEGSAGPEASKEAILTGTQTARQYANWGGDFVISQYGETRTSKHSPTIRTPSGGNRMPMVRVKEATSKGYAEAAEGDSINLAQPNSATPRGRVGKGVANTLETGVQQAVVQAVDTKQVGKARFTDNVATLGANDYKEPKAVSIENRIRRLTPVECERLQGFPDGWTEGQSDTQRYKQMGNAVTVNVVEAVASRIFQSIGT